MVDVELLEYETRLKTGAHYADMYTKAVIQSNTAAITNCL